MNAPVDQLAFHVHHYLPEAEGEALKLRCDLIKARDYAAVLRGRVTSPHAQAHAIDAHEVAGAFVFDEEASETQLSAALTYCRALVKAAMAADLIEWMER
jgi:hypothetical protein